MRRRVQQKLRLSWMKPSMRSSCWSASVLVCNSSWPVCSLRYYHCKLSLSLIAAQAVLLVAQASPGFFSQYSVPSCEGNRPCSRSMSFPAVQ